jgi:hypothetical protein
MAGGLPAGWALRVSRSKGRVFYYNARTQETRWDRPEAADADAATVDDESERHAAKRQRTTALGEDEDERTATVDDADPSKVEVGGALRALIAASMRAGGATVRGPQSKPVAFSPWEHQLAAVEKLVVAIQADKATGDQVRRSLTLKAPRRVNVLTHWCLAQECERFLFQHSTGAGKTMTIAAAVRRFGDSCPTITCHSHARLLSDGRTRRTSFFW